ncbi:uncharacterized protein LOC114322232 [Camellia sinensis]|uniref:uncharacterized protein LOC114322232 n=1 Tax=Camellia sinensis TaxID=4442 RepID=UPI00103554CC|nr:uncharacterized protein LOC114322232 [Camellia sinensis]
MLKLPTYVNVLEMAVIAEGNLVAENRISEWKGKRQNNQLPRGSVTPPNKKQNSGTSGTSTPTPDSVHVCSTCRKKHRGTCYRLSGACFRCGKTGHLVRDCPQRNQQNGDVQNAATVVSGTFIVHDHSAHVLFDSGSTHSFVSKLFAQNLDRSEEVLSYMLCVSSPLEDFMICTSVYFACELQIGDIRLYANLLPLDMTSFDIIMGMDWLSEYGATIDCLTKQISFHPPRQSECTFQGHGVASPPYLISVAKACKLIQKWCQGYLCSVLERQVTNGSTDMIPVVCEFPDVFPEELSGELVDREIEFTIEVIPGTQPISKTPYRMSPVEMK